MSFLGNGTPADGKMIYRSSQKEADPELSKFKAINQKSKITSVVDSSFSQNSNNFFVAKTLLNDNLYEKSSEILETIQQISKKKSSLIKIRSSIKKNKPDYKNHMHDDSPGTSFKEFMEGKNVLPNILTMRWDNSWKSALPHTMLHKPSPGTVNPELYNY